MIFCKMSKIFFLQNLVVILLGSVKNEESSKSQSAEHSTFAPVDPKIIGGSQARIEEARFVAGIHIKYNDNPFGKGHICGGSLITSTRILSAAHCIKDMPYEILAEDLTVVLGMLHRTQPHPFTLTFDVEGYFVHEDYNISGYSNDIAMLGICGHISKGNIIRPIKLNTNEARTGTMCKIYGWGATSTESKRYHHILLVADIFILNQTLCKDIYSKMDSGMICAGTWDGEKDSCVFDSGGPLACDNVLFGIVSWGNMCGIPEFPGIYTNISYFQPWIEKQLLKTFNSKAAILEISKFPIILLIILFIFIVFEFT